MSYTQTQNNGLAITSFVIGIISWLLFVILLCLNYVVLPVFSIITMGAGLIFYVFTLIAGCISPIGWLIGTTLGYTAKAQIIQSGRRPSGIENMGLIINVIGLGLTILGICLFVLYVVLVGGIGFLDQMQY